MAWSQHAAHRKGTETCREVTEQGTTEPIHLHTECMTQVDLSLQRDSSTVVLGIIVARKLVSFEECNRGTKRLYSR